MNGFFRSFYGKISAVYLVLLLVLGGVTAIVTFRSTTRLAAEVEQRLHADYAANIATELRPLYDSNDNTSEDIQHAIHFMMVLNPQVEIYLLDGDGAIVSYFSSGNNPMPQGPVDLSPIERYLTAETPPLILGPDPRNPEMRTPFSAARLDSGEIAPEYVYVVLEGSRYDSAFETLRNSYIARAGFVSLVVTLVCAALGGLVLFFLLTRRVRTLSSAVGAFRSGQLDKRVYLSGRDEIAELGRSFNEMADRIESDIEKLERSDRTRRELVANVSHDLRSPLSSIQGYLETALMKDADLEPAERKRLLETSMESARALQSLVDQLFELSKLEAAEAAPRFEPANAAELANDVVLTLGPDAESQGIGLEVQTGEAQPLVRADVAMVERALRNLIHNAISHTPGGGAVTVRLNAGDEAVEIAVGDTGNGIPAEELPYIFDRFYRVDKSRASRGAGLGLAIAWQIVRLHGSRLTVESEVNRGTTFRFELPLWEASEEERAGAMDDSMDDYPMDDDYMKEDDM